MKPNMCLGTGAVISMFSLAGCARNEGQVEARVDRDVAVNPVNEPASWEIREGQTTAELKLPEPEDRRLEATELPSSVASAIDRQGGGDIESAEYYVAGDTAVYVVLLNGADGSRELTIRQDGVVLLDRTNPATREVNAAEPTVSIRDWRE